MKICAATGNPGKLRELRRILEAQGHQVLSQKELGLDLEPEETGVTFEENAAIRLRLCARPAACPPLRMTLACAWMPWTVRPAYTAPAIAAATATMKPTTINCCRRWPLCRKDSARRSLFPPFA